MSEVLFMKPDPGSIGVDTFLHKWVDGFNAFPPCNMIDKLLNKIFKDKCKGIFVSHSALVSTVHEIEDFRFV